MENPASDIKELTFRDEPSSTYNQSSSSNNDLLLDVRNQDEIDSIRYNMNDKKYKRVVYIPSTLIKYNVDFLLDCVQHYNNIYIICKSGARSTKVKETYFMDHSNVHVNSVHFNTLEDEHTIQSGEWHLSITRKIQIISGSIILLLFSLVLFYNKVKYMFLLFGLVMVYVGLSGNCFMSSILAKDNI